MTLTYIIIAGLVIMLASLSGVLLAWKSLEKAFDRGAVIFTSLSIGVFSVVVFTLFRESFHEGLGVSDVFLWGISGAMFLHLVGHIIPQAHHHHDTSHQDHPHSRLDARRLLAGDAIHNIGDGLILVPAFLIDVRFGVATTVGVFLHELTQEVAQFFILKNAGYSTRRALAYNFIVSSTIFVGIGLSLNFAFSGEQIAVVFAIAGGGFLYVIIRDLLPHVAHVMHCDKKYFLYPFVVFAGTVMMLLVNLAIPHSHEMTGEQHVEGYDDHGDH